MSGLKEHVLEELVTLNADAEMDAAEARRLVTTGVGSDPTDGLAIAYALLAIERRLAMVTLFVLAAMEDDDDD